MYSMLKDLSNKDYIRKLLDADSDNLCGLWWERSEDLFESVDVILEYEQCNSNNTYRRYIYKCTENGKFYEYAYWEDYFGEQSCFSFRGVEKKPVVNYTWG